MMNVLILFSSKTTSPTHRLHNCNTFFGGIFKQKQKQTKKNPKNNNKQINKHFHLYTQKCRTNYNQLSKICFNNDQFVFIQISVAIFL
jgi:hypothetical protein